MDSGLGSLHSEFDQNPPDQHYHQKYQNYQCYYRQGFDWHLGLLPKVYILVYCIHADVLLIDGGFRRILVRGFVGVIVFLLICRGVRGVSCR